MTDLLWSAGGVQSTNPKHERGERNETPESGASGDRVGLDAGSPFVASRDRHSCLSKLGVSSNVQLGWPSLTLRGGEEGDA